MKEYRTLRPFLKENRWHYFWGVLWLMIVDVGNIWMPQILMRFADWAEQGALTMPRARETAWAMMLCGAVIAAGRYFWRVEIYGTARKLDHWLRDLLFTKYLSLDDAFFGSRSTGDLMAHATQDIFMVRNTMGGGVIMGVDAIFMGILTIIMMIRTVGAKTAGVALLSLPALTVVMLCFMNPLQQRSRAVQDRFSALTAGTQENLSGIYSIKAFGIERNRAAAFMGLNEDYRQANLSLMHMGAFFEPFVGLVAGVAFSIFIWYGAGRMQAGALSLGDFVAVAYYLRLLIWPLMAVGMVIGGLQRGVASMTRINEILAAEPQVKEAASPSELPDGPFPLEFRHVSFSYGKGLPRVLDDVSFTLEEGEKLALVGRTGCGKSTLLSLILRRYDVSSGQILLAGQDLRDLSFDSLYRQFSTVEQEVFLFSDSIAGNIAFSGALDMDRVREAARFAAIEEEILAMPEGFASAVGERGVTLSGGQRQRIAIARAVYHPAPLLIFDDALSAVDTETEARILQAIDEEKRSLILVSQRVSTVQHADRILVLEDGKITQMGTHEELLKDKDGFYARLHERQLLERRLKGEVEA